MIIYKITNKINNKIYVGLTVKKSAQHRFIKHVSEANCSKENRYLLKKIRDNKIYKNYYYTFK